METSRLLYGRVTRIVLVLTCVLAAGCGEIQKKPPTGQKQHIFDCGDQTVGVVPNDGTNPKAVYLCDGDKLSWVPNGHQFVVTFKKSPFVDGQLVFQNNPQNPNALVQSSAAQYTGSLVVYHYTITIDGKPVDDPQVVGGGGH